MKLFKIDPYSIEYIRPPWTNLVRQSVCTC